jgi:hypothetical protein
VVEWATLSQLLRSKGNRTRDNFTINSFIDLTGLVLRLPKSTAVY